MPYLETLIYIVLAHALGDYFLQTSYIANGKGKDDYLLFIHCVLYVVPFVLFFGITWHLIPLFAVHIVTDRLKARHNKINLLADQIIHYAVALLYLI